MNIQDNKLLIWQLYEQHKYKRVLELGPWLGTDTTELIKQTDELVTIEGRIENIRILAELDLPQLQIIHNNIEILDLNKLGYFDCVWASGILYHMPEPWKLIWNITEVTNLVYGWTHLASDVEGIKEGWHGAPFKEDVENSKGGLSPTSWWLTFSEFQRAWAEGYFHCLFVTRPVPHIHGGLVAEYMAFKKD